MMIGPAPMIRMVEMSVRFGIRSSERVRRRPASDRLSAQKKAAPRRRREASSGEGSSPVANGRHSDRRP
jgi:hypothetical protein